MDVITWLLASDPAIRWQVGRDLLGWSPDEVAAERSRVAAEGWGAELLSHRDPDGQWAGGAFIPAELRRVYESGGEPEDPHQPWTATCWALVQLADLGLDPDFEVARETTELVGRNSRWEYDGSPFWDGEVEACINGRTVRVGAYFGADVDAIVEYLLRDQLDDGGWNCEVERGATVSSFDSTINVVEGLLEWERSVPAGHPRVDEVHAARLRGEEYLLVRQLMRRLSTGEVPVERWLQPTYPPRWQYDVLRALDHFRGTGAAPDPRTEDAIALLESQRQDDGRWLLERALPGQTWLDLGETVGAPSRWNTLRAMRVLEWARRGSGHVIASVGYAPVMSNDDPRDSTEDLGRIDDDAEQEQTSSTTDGAAAEGEYDPAQGSPDATGHPTGEDFPDEAVRYDEPDERPRSQTDDS